MKKIATAIILISLLALSCKSAPEEGNFDNSNLPGMIYDADNRPCEKVKITVFKIDNEGNENELFSVPSDINGRFTLPGLSRDSYRVTAEREGYESISTDLYYSSRLDVLYLKIYSQKQILNSATEALRSRKFGNVEKLLIRSEKVNGNDPYHLYLSAVFYYDKDELNTAEEQLNRIVDLGYEFPYVYLLLADIYQYKLNDRNRALEQLKIYINLIDDMDIESRIGELEEDDKG